MVAALRCKDYVRRRTRPNTHFEVVRKQSGMSLVMDEGVNVYAVGNTIVAIFLGVAFQMRLHLQGL